MSGGDTRPDGPTTPSDEIPHPLVRALAGALGPMNRSVLTQASVPLDDRPLEPGTRDSVIPNDRYSILKLCGEGGMSQVYNAFNRDLNRVVALKATIAASSSACRARSPASSKRRRPRRSSSTLASCRSTTSDCSKKDGRFYFTMKVVSS